MISFALHCLIYLTLIILHRAILVTRVYDTRAK